MNNKESISIKENLKDSLTNISNHVIDSVLKGQSDLYDNDSSTEIKNFKINFKINLLTDDTEISTIFFENTNIPSITIKYDDIDNKNEYNEFKNLHELTDHFSDKVKTINTESLVNFRKKYSKIKGGDKLFYLNIDFDIIITVKKENDDIIVEKYLFKIIELSADNIKENQKLNYDTLTGFSKKIEYKIDISNLDEKLQNNISKYLNNLSNEDIYKTEVIDNESGNKNWQEVNDGNGGIYYWNKLTNETTKIGDPNPDLYKESKPVGKESSQMIQQSKSVIDSILDNIEKPLEIKENKITKINAYSSCINISKYSYKIMVNQDIYSDWIKYDELIEQYQSWNTNDSNDSIEINIFQNWIHNFLGYELIRINRLLMVFNTDLFSKILTLLSDDTFSKKYIDFFKNVYLKINIVDLETIYSSDNIIFKTIDSNTKKYNEIIGQQTDNYIFSYLLFKHIFNDFFKTAIRNDYTKLKNMGNTDNQSKNFRIMLNIILNIEKNTIEMIMKFIEKKVTNDIQNIEKDFYNLMKSNKRVFSIVKRRHDNFDYDENHPIFRTKENINENNDNQLKYLDVYFINNPETIKLFTYYDPYARYKLTLSDIDPQQKTKLEQFRIDNNFNDTSNIVTTNDKPEYFYKDKLNNIIHFDTNKYTEKHKFGPFDYLYNEPRKTNGEIATDIKHNLDYSLINNNVMMNGFGQSGSGKTSTLIKLIAGEIIEDGVLIEYLKSLNSELNSIKIECVNIYFKDPANKITNEYESFLQQNYLIQIYGQENIVLDLDDLNKINEHKDDIFIKNFTLDGYNNDFDKMIGDVGTEILHLFDRRQVLPSPNNEKSSRSHIIVCLTLNGNIIKNKKLIVCDLAGVENKFQCAQEDELRKFDIQYNILKKAAEKGDQQAKIAYNQLFNGNYDLCTSHIEKSVEEYKNDEKYKKMLENINLPTEIIKKFENSYTDIKLTIFEEYFKFIEKLKKMVNFLKLQYILYGGNIAYINKLSSKCDEILILRDEYNKIKNTQDQPDENGRKKFIKIKLNIFSESIEFFKDINEITNIPIDEMPKFKDDNFKQRILIENIWDSLNSNNFTNDEGENIVPILDTKGYLSVKDQDVQNTIMKKYENLTYNKNKILISRANPGESEQKFSFADILRFYSYIIKNSKLKITYMNIEKFINNIEKEIIINKQKFINFNKYSNSLLENIKKENISLLEPIKTEIDKNGESGECLSKRFEKIREDCRIRVHEGFMINKSLAELSKGIAKIVYENSFKGLPIYIEKQIDPKCRNNFLDYYTFDKFKEESIETEDWQQYSDENGKLFWYNKTTNESLWDKPITYTEIKNDLDKYGIILCILKYYFKIPLNKLIIYNLLVYNTTFFAEPGQSGYKTLTKERPINSQNYNEKVTYIEPMLQNTGNKNNPPNPPYVNLNILKYFTRINKNEKKIREIADIFFIYLLKYEFYSIAIETDQLKKLNSEPVIKQVEKWITFIERNNSGTLLGTLDSTDMLQTITFNDVACNSISEENVNDENYKKIVKIFNETTSNVIGNSKEALKNTKMISESSSKFSNYIDELFTVRNFRGNVSEKKGGITIRKYKGKRKTIKRKFIKTRKIKNRNKRNISRKKY
jgi:hypothetical protein